MGPKGYFTGRRSLGHTLLQMAVMCLESADTGRLVVSRPANSFQASSLGGAIALVLLPDTTRGGPTVL